MNTFPPNFNQPPVLSGVTDQNTTSTPATSPDLEELFKRIHFCAPPEGAKPFAVISGTHICAELGLPPIVTDDCIEDSLRANGLVDLATLASATATLGLGAAMQELEQAVAADGERCPSIRTGQ